MTPRERAWLRRWIDAHADPNADPEARRDLIRARAIVDRVERDADETERVAAAVAAEREACAQAVESAGRGCASVTAYEIAARAILARGEAPKVEP